MLTITFHNDSTGDVRLGNYDYIVYINEVIIAEGRVERHQRNRGWRGLLRKLLKELDKKSPSSSFNPQNVLKG